MKFSALIFELLRKKKEQQKQNSKEASPVAL